MTDYRKWDKFDCDEVEEEIDQREKIKKFQNQATKSVDNSLKKHLKISNEAQMIAEILEAKVNSI